MTRPIIILVEPQLAENIGMVARAMANFGLSELRLVSPRNGWPKKGAHSAASGATHVLESATLYDNVREAIADLNFVFATTARERGQMKRVFAPDAAMKEAQARLGAGQGIGILFGRERTGLENDEVSLADAIITFPVDPKFSSLNLAQAVLLVVRMVQARHWRCAALRRRPAIPAGPARDGDVVLRLYRERARGGELLSRGQEADHDPQHAGHLPPSRDDRAGGPHPARGDSRPCGRAQVEKTLS